MLPNSQDGKIFPPAHSQNERSQKTRALTHTEVWNPRSLPTWWSEENTTKGWRWRDPLLRRRGWLGSLTDGKHWLMCVFSEPSVRRRGWWEKLDPDKRSVEEMNGVYRLAAAVLRRTNQINNQDKQLARNQLLVTFSKQQSNSDAASVVSGQEPSSVTPSLTYKFTRLPTLMGETWASSPKRGSLGPAVIKAHGFDPVWDQSGWDGGRNRERRRETSTP